MYKFNGPPTFPQKQNLNNGSTKVSMGMPQKFRYADGNNDFSQGRQIFLNTPVCYAYINGIRIDSNSSLCSKNITHVNWAGSSSHTVHGRKSNGVLNNGKQNIVTSSDQYIQRKKNRAIGSGSTNRQSELFSFKTNENSNLNTINNALSKCRSGGCVAPPKKSAVRNNL